MVGIFTDALYVQIDSWLGRMSIKQTNVWRNTEDGLISIDTYNAPTPAKMPFPLPC